jgi:translation initiation factor IF-3
VRVIGADGSQVGILQTHEALRLAEEQGLELVEVNPRAAPPVCKIMDFGKFKYETSKKEKASRRHQSTIVLKEIKLRPKTDKHDLDFKVTHIREFLSEGNKCKLVIVFRGREIVHPETGWPAVGRCRRRWRWWRWWRWWIDGHVVAAGSRGCQVWVEVVSETAAPPRFARERLVCKLAA